MTDIVKDYCELEKQKRALLDAKAEIDAKMEPLRQLILDRSRTTGKNIMEISPEDEEEMKRIGSTGALVVKTSNKYEDFNRGNLRNACLKYYKMLFPDHELSNLEKIAHGQAEYMWAERECVQTMSIDRTFVEPVRSKPRAKRQKTEIQKPVELLPKTREDFYKLNIFDLLEQ